MKIAIKYLVFLLGLFLTGQAAVAQSKMQNFSGTWVLNADKSNFGRLTVASMTKMMTITMQQLDHSISITTGDSTEHTEDQVNLDGTPSRRMTNKLINGIPNIIKKSLTVQVINQQSFIETMSDPNESPSLNVRTYGISADQQTLTMDYKVTYGHAEYTGKLLYDRKKSS